MFEKEITELDFSENFSTTEMDSNISKCINLKSLDYSCSGLQSLNWKMLEGLKSLTKLFLSDNYDLTDISGLGSLVRLKELGISDMNESLDISVVEKLVRLEKLWVDERDVSYVLSIQDKLVNLKYIEVVQFDELRVYQDLREVLKGFRSEIEVYIDLRR